MSHPKSTDGILPIIFNHYTALPQLYNFDSVPVEKLSDTISRQFVMGGQSMIVKWMFKKGAVVPLHFHPNEQITWITEGVAEVKSQGKTFVVEAGGVIIFPAYVPHEFTILEDTIDIDFFSPVRADWLNDSADYLRQK